MLVLFSRTEGNEPLSLTCCQLFQDGRFRSFKKSEATLDHDSPQWWRSDWRLLVHVS